jgi:serine/threonine-protein kinase
MIVAAVVIAYVVGETDNPSGPQGQAPDTAGGPVRITAVSDLDPYGGGEEHSEEAPLAADGEASTAWTTEDYQDSFELIGKAGVGLVFDLGRATSVTKAEITLGTPGLDIELRAADEPGAQEGDFELIERIEEAPASVDIEVDADPARYWLVWITGLPGEGGGSASIAEARFFK